MNEWIAPPDPDTVAGPPQATPFQWNLTNGAKAWTKDARELARLSDAPIIDGILREREVVSIVGAAKTRKTWFALALALAVANGAPFLGHETHRRKVLYLDYELKPGTFRKRMSLLSPVKPVGFFYQCLRGEERLPTVDEIAAIVAAEGFGLVVVDSLYRTEWIAEENNNDTTSRDLKKLQRFTHAVACSLLVVDHTAKGGGAERSAVDASRGASSKGGFFDALLVLRATDKGPDPAGKYCILDPVVRDWPEIEGLPLVSFSWDGSNATVESVGTVAPGAADSNATKLLEALAGAGKPMGRAALIAATGIPETTCRKVLAKLVASKQVAEAPAPNHSQRLVYRLADLMDEPRETPENSTL